MTCHCNAHPPPRYPVPSLPTGGAAATGAGGGSLCMLLGLHARHASVPAVPPRRAALCGAGLINILIVLALVAMTLSTQPSAPNIALEPRPGFSSELYTARRGVPFYVRDDERFEAKYPTGRPERRRVEDQVRPAPPPPPPLAAAACCSVSAVIALLLAWCCSALRTMLLCLPRYARRLAD